MNTLLIACLVTGQTIPIEMKNNIFFSSEYLLPATTSTKNADVEEIIIHILDTYADAGFPFCRVYPEVIYADSTPTKVVLTIAEGERVIIHDYLFKIQGKTLRSVVKKITQAKPQSYFSCRHVEQSKRKILATGVFSNVSDQIVFDKDTYYVLFSLQEALSDYVTVFGSLALDEFTFSASLHSRNLLGTLRQLRFLYEYRKLFSLEFVEPILIYPTALSVTFELWSYDSARLVQFSGNVMAPIGEHCRLILLSGIERSSMLRDGSAETEQTSSLLGIGGSVSMVNRQWSTEHHLLFDYLFRDHDRWRATYDGLLRIFHFEIRPHYHYVDSDALQYFDFLRIGGSENLRGHFNDEFLVHEARWVNIEYRRFFLFPLIDVAWLDQEVTYSYGFGIEAQSRFGTAQLVFAWPRHGLWGDGKIHFMLEKGFK